MTASNVAEAVEQILCNPDRPDVSASVQTLIKQSAAEFIRQRRWNDAFRVLAMCRLSESAMMDAELFRLRNALLLHEQRRVTRVRRILLIVLGGVLLYLFCVSPTVFVSLENPHRLAHGMEVLDWSEGLYWSVITSATVGYGDI